MELSHLLGALNPSNLLASFIGTVIGLFLGVLPGIGSTLAVALFIPFTLAMAPEAALILLGAIYGGAVFGGSVTSIVINVPGTAANAVTTLEGYPLAKQGRAGFAIGIAAGSSFVGGVLGVLSLWLLGPPLARLSLQFGPREYFILALLGIMMIARASPTSTVKGIASGLLGLLFSTVGLSAITAYPRFTYGSSYLFDGFPLVPTIIGIFGLSEVLSLMLQGQVAPGAAESLRNVLSGVRLPFTHLYVLLKSSLLGIFIGVLPGVGAEVANTVAYVEARRTSRRAERYGKGEPEGLVAAESANNAAVAATLVPTLTLGIPGSAVAALFAAPLIMHGLRPGRDLFIQSGHIFGHLVGGLLLANIMMLLLGIAGAPLFARVTRVPAKLLLGPVTFLCLTGAFAARNSFSDMIFACIAGVAGYALRRGGYSLPAFIIGFVLGPVAEQAFGQAMLIGGGDPLYFLRSGWAVLFSLVGVFILIQPAVMRRLGAINLGRWMGTLRSH